MAVLYGMPTIQYSAGSSPQSAHKLFTSCIRRCLHSVTCLRLNDVSVICRVTYFQFPIQSAFLPCRSTRSTAAYVLCPISDIGRCKKIKKYVACTQRTAQGKDCGLILTVKMKTRHPIKGYFGSEFRAICNHRGVMRSEVTIRRNLLRNFCAFLKKTTSYCKIYKKNLLGKFSPSHRSTFLCWNFVKFCRRRNRALLTRQKNFGCLSLLRRSRPKSVCIQSAPDFIQIGSLSEEL